MTLCPICISVALPYKISVSYEFFKCEQVNCGHVFVWPPPSPQELAKIYSDENSSIANSNGYTLLEDYREDPNVIRSYFHKRQIKSLKKISTEFKNKEANILDVGCSTGMLLRVLKDEGYKNLAGFDISECACRLVEQEHDITCYSDLDNIPDKKFDLIILFEVLEHVADPVFFLSALTKKLSPSGRIWVVVPNFDSPYARLFKSFWVWWIPPIHLQYFTRNSLVNTFTASGLNRESLGSFYTGTYIFLIVHFICLIFGGKIPSTSRTSSSTWVRNFIFVSEKIIRILLAPFSLVLKARSLHFEIYVFGGKI
uniref:class I SAM-dependent methyltransferase n=1 Tax=Polynucleobacter sp. TaxID=2029855 RepID=UPI004047866A